MLVNVTNVILSKFLSIKFQSIRQRTISFSIKYENIKFYLVSVYLLTNGNLYSLDHSEKSKYKKVFYAIKDMKLVLAVGKCLLVYKSTVYLSCTTCHQFVFP